MLLISWLVFLFIKTKDFISLSEITLDKAILSSVGKYFSKTQMHNSQKKRTLCISDILFNTYQLIKLNITYSVRKETIRHLTMDINLTFHMIICVKKRFRNILKMLVTIANAIVFIWSTLKSILILLFQRFQNWKSFDFTMLRSIFKFYFPIFNFQFYFSIWKLKIEIRKRNWNLKFGNFKFNFKQKLIVNCMNVRYTNVNKFSWIIQSCFMT